MTDDSEHVIHRLDDDVHQRVRLGILAALTGVTRADFGHLKARLGLTDGNLGRHLQVLENGGLVAIDKQVDGRRSRTWIKLTRRGRAALRRELDALRELIAQVDDAAASTATAPGRPADRPSDRPAEVEL